MGVYTGFLDLALGRSWHARFGQWGRGGFPCGRAGGPGSSDRFRAISAFITTASAGVRRKSAMLLLMSLAGVAGTSLISRNSGLQKGDFAFRGPRYLLPEQSPP